MLNLIVFRNCGGGVNPFVFHFGLSTALIGSLRNSFHIIFVREIRGGGENLFLKRNKILF